jgi:hypothetical protein
MRRDWCIRSLQHVRLFGALRLTYGAVSLGSIPTHALHAILHRGVERCSDLSLTLAIQLMPFYRCEYALQTYGLNPSLQTPLQVRPTVLLPPRQTSRLVYPPTHHTALSLSFICIH